MKRDTQPEISADGYYALDHDRQVLQQLDDIPLVTIRKYFSDLRQFIAWRKDGWRGEQEECKFTSQAVAQPLLTRYRENLQTSLDLKPFTVNRALMSLKRYFAWARIRSIVKCKTLREVLFKRTVRSIVDQYLEAIPLECQELFPSEKTHRALTGRALEHLVTKYATQTSLADGSPHNLCQRFGYRMAEGVLSHRPAQCMEHDSLDTTMLSMRGIKQDLQQDVEKITWIEKN